MTKSNYFSHDSNARNDDKIIAMRMQMGAEGYAIYFMLLERLRDSDDHTSVKDYNMLAFDFRVDASSVKKVVECFGLFQFTNDGKRFYSESFTKRMQMMESKRARQSEAGKLAMKKRWSGSSGNVTNLGESDNLLITNLGESDNKEKKRKENKVNNSVSTKADTLSDSNESDDAVQGIHSSGEGKSISENFGKNQKIPEKSEKIQEKTPISKVKYSIEGDTSTNADVLSDSHESDTANATETTLFGVEEVQEKQDSVNYEELAKYWNDTTKGVYGKLLSIDHNRRKMTSARIKEYGKDKFAEAIRKASKSEYLKSVAWFNFDWMIKPNNFPKLLEGNYDERKQEAKHTDPVGNTRTGGRGEGVHREREYE